MSGKTIITNIGRLVQVRDKPTAFVSGADMGVVPGIDNAYLTIENGLITGYGASSEAPDGQHYSVIDAAGGFVFPGYVDAHTHLVFAQSRQDEFVMKVKGASYAEIAAQGGGILNSAKTLQRTSEEELYDRALPRVEEIIKTGTVAVEIKSGYGLTLQDELKMLRVARRLGRDTPLKVRTTFLGAHAFPQGLSREAYIRLIIEEMIPAVADEKLADYIDVFCEKGFFSPDETEEIAICGAQHSMPLRLHANQLGYSGGVQVGVKMKAKSVDHLEHIGEEEILELKDSNVMPTALPGAAFFLDMPFPPARKIIEAGLPLVIASDFNPGSAPSGNMNLMVALGCIKMKLTPEEACNAVTLNAAWSLDWADSLGSISIGKEASVFITQPIPSLSYLPYRFGENLIKKVLIQGNVVAQN